MNLVYYPDPLLKKIAQPIEKIDARLEEFVDEMFQAMFKYKGCGLAAPQIGVSKRVLVYNHTDKMEDCIVLINPKILAQEGNDLGTEGCLSFPEIVGEVSRFHWIKVETLTLQGELKTFEAEDFHARVIQHEIDHLNGVLFTEKMEPQDVTLAQPELKKLQKHYKSIQQNSKSRLTSIR